MDFQVDARTVDLILGLVALEALGFVAFGTRIAPALGPGRVLWNLLAGAALLVALRSALLGLPWQWLAGSLLLALVAHIGDLWQRWRQR
jgi:hypothetical protein